MTRQALVGLAATYVVAASFIPSALGATRLTTPLTPEGVNDVELTGPVGPKMKGAAVLRAQVLLERAHFSPGEIDAAYGSNTQTAIAGFQKKNGLDPSGTACTGIYIGGRSAG